MVHPLIILLLLLTPTLASAPREPLIKSFTLTSSTGHTIHASARLDCETTTASPKISDIRGVIANLRAVEGEYSCVQLNAGGSRCTKIAKYAGADISLCGRWKSRISCDEAADAAESVVKTCEWNGKAGGRWYFEGQNLNLALH